MKLKCKNFATRFIIYYLCLDLRNILLANATSTQLRSSFEKQHLNVQSYLCNTLQQDHTTTTSNGKKFFLNDKFNHKVIGIEIPDFCLQYLIRSSVHH